MKDRTRVSINLMDSRHVQTVPIRDTFLLVVDIPRATRLRRPVYLGLHPFTGTYRCLHEGDYHCSEVEVRRMLADADPIPRDHRILKGFTLEDLDASTLAQYRQLLRVVRPDSTWHVLPDRELLERVGGWRRDHGTGEEGLTLAGLLFQFYHRVIPKLYAGLPTPFQLVDGQRRDYTPAHEGLREAFVNALIHADYSVGGGVVVERFPDRFVFHNPGTLLISQEQYRRGGISECRNPALAALKARFGEALESLSLSERHVLATAHLEGAVSNLRLQEILEDHKADITRLLQGLCERGFLTRSGRGRWTTYVISEPENPQGDLLDAHLSTGDSYHKEVDSYHKGGENEAPGPASKDWELLEKIAEPVSHA